MHVGNDGRLSRVSHKLHRLLNLRNILVGTHFSELDEGEAVILFCPDRFRRSRFGILIKGRDVFATRKERDRNNDSDCGKGTSVDAQLGRSKSR